MVPSHFDGTKICTQVRPFMGNQDIAQGHYYGDLCGEEEMNAALLPVWGPPPLRVCCWWYYSYICMH